MGASALIAACSPWVTDGALNGPGDAAPKVKLGVGRVDDGVSEGAGDVTDSDDDLHPPDLKHLICSLTACLIAFGHLKGAL